MRYVIHILFIVVILWLFLKPPQNKSKPSENSNNQKVWPKLFAVFPGGWNGGGGLVHAFNRQIHRQAADWYVSSFYESHGCWPVGAHSFDIRFAPDGSAPIRTPIGRSSGTRRVTIKFVIVPWRERADYLGTDLRYEVKAIKRNDNQK